jgi:hypothetical protein
VTACDDGHSVATTDLTAADALALLRPLPDGALQIVACRAKKDGRPGHRRAPPRLVRGYRPSG